MIKLGSKVKDNITGFAGIATGRRNHLHGCVHIAIEPMTLDKDGKVQDGHWFDEQRVVVWEPDPDIKTTPPTIPLGSKVRDKLSGFAGIVITTTEWLYGAPRVEVESDKLKSDGERLKAETFPESRIELMEAREPVVSKHSSATSGSATDERVSHETTR